MHFFRSLGVSSLLVLYALAVPAAAEEHRHGISAFGDLKYGPEFSHFDYVNPQAPKGGEISTYAGGTTFDSLNPFILKGVPAAGVALTFDSLMARATDEIDAMYGLVAETSEVAEDGTWIKFYLRQAAQFHDGTPIRADDVVFTFNALVEKGHPFFRILLRDVAGVEAIDLLTVQFSFTPGEGLRDLPLTVAGLPILSRKHFETRDFGVTTWDPILGSGAYRVGNVNEGQSITFDRVEDYWAQDLPVNKGRNNFDHIRLEYFRERAIALEAFKARAYTFREEFTAKDWRTGYEIEQVADGRIITEVIPDNTASGLQGFFMNTRHDKFADIRVREAIASVYDFEWANKTLFYDMYVRTNSIFENSELGADGLPSEAELLLLEPFRSQLPGEVFGEPFQSPVSPGDGNIRAQLRTASRLLDEAGWKLEDGKRKNAAGEALVLEFIDDQPSMDRVVTPFIQNLNRLGVDANFRIMDSTALQNRLEQYDYDIVMSRMSLSLTPGTEQRNYWSSAFADVPGGPNRAGIKNPVVDALVEEVINAGSRENLITAARALDRVVMWNHYFVPNWYKGSHNIAYWNQYSRPVIKPRYDRGVLDLWWYDAEKAALLQSGGSALE